MTALLIARNGESPAVERRRNAALASLARQGFPDPLARSFAGGTLYWYGSPGAVQPLEAFQDMGNDGQFVACVGTLFYRERTGSAALRELWADFSSPEALGCEALWGNFQLILAKAGKVWLIGDPVGTIKVYRTTDDIIWSTSWMACADGAESRETDPIGVIDYVMSGANHGERTPLAGVQIAEPSLAFELVGLESRGMRKMSYWTDRSRFATKSQAIEAAAEILTERARAIARGFPNRIRSALSGGFDSRLILAAMRSAGANPLLHVYGTSSDSDVRIATLAAQSVGMALEQIDKAGINRSLPSLDESEVSRQAAFFDGIPTDGVFDRGADRLTRIRQSADGFVALNGGGGEIFRNFFYLHDRPFTAAQIVQTFYSNWHPAAVPSARNRKAYFDYLVDAIERAVGANGTLSRDVVELVYPLFRVRYWTSRNNSIAARCGHFLTPLVDPELVRVAQALPLSWKDYGSFEAALITRLDRTLGGVPLSYGFTPAQGPDWRYRARMWLQHHRPPWLRAQTQKVRALLNSRRPGKGPSRRLSLIRGSPAGEALLDTRRIFEPEQLCRIDTLDAILN